MTLAGRAWRMLAAAVLAGWVGVSAAAAASSTFTYDKLNRLTSATIDGSLIVYTYDAAGNLTRVLTPYSIAVTVSGTGSVTDDRGKIDCGADCSGAYTLNDLVTLTAAADPDWVFEGWSGACSGTGPCVVSATGLLSVTASFIPPPSSYQLEVSKVGTGGGTVTSDPAGIDCGATCEHDFDTGSSVDLSAAAEAGSWFAGWSEPTCGCAATCTVTMSQARSLTATFTPLPTVTPSGPTTFCAGGSVTLEAPAGYASYLWSPGSQTTQSIDVFEGGSYSVTVGNTAGCTASSASVDVTVNPLPTPAITGPTEVPAGSSVTLEATAGYESYIWSLAGVSAQFAHYPFSGNANDAGENGLDGTVNGATLTTDRFGEADSAYFFNGSSSSIDVVGSENLFDWAASESLTLAAWVRKDTTDTLYRPVVNTEKSVWQGFGLYVHGSSLALESSAGWIETDAAIPTGTWTHLAIVNDRTAGEIRFYKNGSLVDTHGGAAPFSMTGESYLRMGRQQTSGSLFQGAIDDVRVYRGALASTEIALVAGSGASGQSIEVSPTSTTTYTVTVLSTEGCVGTSPGHRVTVTAPLSVTKVGSGAGTVTSDPVGIDCGSTCEAQFAMGSTVTLSASAAPGSTFTGWSGGGCSGTDPCDVAMDGAKSVQASFAGSGADLTVNVYGDGSGTVTSAPAGIDCGLVCSYLFPVAETVTLSALADSGSGFAGWSGACSGTVPCEVVMDEAHIVGATFDTCDILIEGQTYSGTETVTNCGSITLGNGVVVESGATVAFRGATMVILGNGCHFAEGATVTIGIDPSLAP